MNPRAAAAQILAQVIDQGRSLTAALDAGLPQVKAEQRPLVQELCYGSLRGYFRLEPILAQLLKKPFKAKDTDLQALLLLGLHQLSAMRIPPHAAVAETVSAVKALGKEWARGLVNAVLRNYQRQAESLQAKAETSEPGRWSHPQWLIDRLRQAWPEDWQTLLTANDEHAPMTLRVNRRHGSRDVYLQRLLEAGIEARATAFSPDGLTLAQPVDVTKLPGFATGDVSVQDEAAQLAAQLLAPEPGQRLLDVCAAPGGKTAHLLELADLAGLQALDLAADRLQRVADNLQRLGLEAKLTAADARTPVDWWDGTPFDRILLDAPCSATGVIRRHPDIKLLRRTADIPALAQLQGEILRACWPLLRPGGILLYATCSVLPEENEAQIQAFLAEQDDVAVLPINAQWGRSTGAGRQILPGDGNGMDGFYFACLQKHATS